MTLVSSFIKRGSKCTEEVIILFDCNKDKFSPNLN